MDIHEIVKKLVGPISPVGETYADNDRFENLKTMTELVDKLVFDINTVIPNKDRVEYSMKKAGEFADKFLTDLGMSIITTFSFDKFRYKLARYSLYFSICT